MCLGVSAFNCGGSKYHIIDSGEWGGGGGFQVLALVARVCYCLLFFVCLEFQIIRLVIKPIFFIKISFISPPPPPPPRPPDIS